MLFVVLIKIITWKCFESDSIDKYIDSEQLDRFGEYLG